MPFRSLLLALLCLGVVHGASARSLTEAEREALPEAVGTFRTALAAQDVVTAMSFLPPLVAVGMAERMGMSVQEMVQAYADRTAESGAQVTVHSVALDLDSAESGDAGGEPYLLIPTEIVITFPDVGKLTQTSHTLAFAEGGEWRLLRLGDPEGLALLRRAYPRFESVEMPEGRLEKVGP